VSKGACYTPCGITILRMCADGFAQIWGDGWQGEPMKTVGRPKAEVFDLLVSELLCGELTQELADQIVEMVADSPEFESGLLAQVRVHNLLCQHFAGERARQGIPETESMPRPLDILVARIQSRRPQGINGSPSTSSGRRPSVLRGRSPDSEATPANPRDTARSANPSRRFRGAGGSSKG
jgi:hypothetical protein